MPIFSNISKLWKKDSVDSIDPTSLAAAAAVSKVTGVDVVAVDTVNVDANANINSNVNMQTAEDVAESFHEDEERSLALIYREFRQGFEFTEKHPRSVSFFGSARFPEGDEHYEEARTLAKKVVQELGYAVSTGGGPGIMQGANQGAMEAGGDSLGLLINLPMEQIINPYITDSLAFSYFFTRKTALSFGAEGYIYFPGGYGTLDELFDILTLIQTKKIPAVPVILIGLDFWRPLDAFIKANMVDKHQTISPEDVNIYHILDDYDEVIRLIRESPETKTNWWHNFQADISKVDTKEIYDTYCKIR